MLEELLNGKYFIYQICDGGCGIVKANTESQAKVIVMDAYRSHCGIDYDYDFEDIECHEITNDNSYFKGTPNVIELGWTIEID